MMPVESGEQVGMLGSVPMRCILNGVLRFTAAQGHGLIAWLKSASRSLYISRWSYSRDAMH